MRDDLADYLKSLFIALSEKNAKLQVLQENEYQLLIFLKKDDWYSFNLLQQETNYICEQINQIDFNSGQLLDKISKTSGIELFLLKKKLATGKIPFSKKISEICAQNNSKLKKISAANEKKISSLENLQKKTKEEINSLKQNINILENFCWPFKDL